MKIGRGIFIQVYDSVKKRWLTVCPALSLINEHQDKPSMSSVLYTDAHQEALADYLKYEEIIYVISSI